MDSYMNPNVNHEFGSTPTKYPIDNSFMRRAGGISYYLSFET